MSSRLLASGPSPKAHGQRLLAWYDAHARALPWRRRDGPADPYHVWLSEIMLQQTTVATVTGYYARFLARWPSVEALAAASLDEVLHAWQGLGYYARARNLHRCAQQVRDELSGKFPETEAGLRALPGIGAYTAAAIAAIAFDRPATVVDGNVERVVSRLHAVETPLPEARPILRQLAEALTPDSRPGDYAQAMMDLGATICTPRKPACNRCPLARGCRARQSDPQLYPRKTARPQRPTRQGVVYWLEDDQGRVLIRRRPASGLLGGLMEFPTSEWRETPVSVPEGAPVETGWHPVGLSVRHTFTHFHLDLAIFTGRLDQRSPDPEGRWIEPERLTSVALPTLMRKVAQAVKRPLR